jgi:hypothetical protein
MKRSVFFILLVIPALALPARGGIFGRKTKVSPEQRVPQLIAIVKTDTSEAKRAEAAAELRDYDARAFPDIVPVLMDVLENDTKPSVRREAAFALGRIRPIIPAVGHALQQAASKDPSLRVRIQAWSSLKIYQLNGFSNRMKEQSTPATPQGITTAEPPLADAPTVQTKQPGPTKAPNPIIVDGPPVQKRPAVTQPASAPPPSSRISNPAEPRPIPQQIVDEGPILTPPPK